MGLLAEARHKQKWSHDPRGKKWSEDKNKISVKMMEKMGWTQGNGLGAKEDGRTEVIKRKYSKNLFLKYLLLFDLIFDLISMSKSNSKMKNAELVAP